MNGYLLAVVFVASVVLSSATQRIGNEVKVEETNEDAIVKKSASSEVHTDCANCLVRKKRFWNGLWAVKPGKNIIHAVKAARKKSVAQMKKYCVSCPAKCYQLSTKLASKTVCQYQRMSLSCPKNETLRIVSALYGRKSRDICRIGRIKTKKCASLASLSATQCRCENKQHCSLKAENTIFGDPCRGTFKYLNVVYRCLRDEMKETGEPRQCKECSGTQYAVCKVFRKHQLFYWGGLWGRELDSDDETAYDLLKDEHSRH